MNLNRWLAAVFVIVALGGCVQERDGRPTTTVWNIHATGVVMAVGEEAEAACSGQGNRTSPDRRIRSPKQPRDRRQRSHALYRAR